MPTLRPKPAAGAHWELDVCDFQHSHLSLVEHKWASGQENTKRPQKDSGASCRCPRGDLNPHPLIRGLAPQASASAYSATRTGGATLAKKQAVLRIGALLGVHQLWDNGRPSWKPAADWMPTIARSWNSSSVRAPAYVQAERTPEQIWSMRSSTPGACASKYIRDEEMPSS